jgi:hypothetical protein
MNLEGARQILLYLLSTKTEGTRLQKPVNVDIVIYTDASYGAKTQESAKSQSGVMTTIEG